MAMVNAVLWVEQEKAKGMSAPTPAPKSMVLEKAKLAQALADRAKRDSHA